MFSGSVAYRLAASARSLFALTFVYTISKLAREFGADISVTIRGPRVDVQVYMGI